MTRLDLERRVAVARQIAERAATRSLQSYLDHITIDSRPDPALYRTIAEPWQRELDALLCPAIESVAGFRDGYSGPYGFWLTMPRGHDKTSREGRYLNWALFASRRRLNCYAAACDEDQANLLAEAMAREADLNPWLGEKVRHLNKLVHGPGGYLKILSADARSSYGKRPDIIVIDEITHWQKRDLFDALYSAWAKRPGSVLVVITNAGVLNSWQDQIRQDAIKNPHLWKVHETPPYIHLASWMDEEKRAAIRKSLPRGLGRRVIDNIWIDAGEESGYLTREEIEACEKLGSERGLGYVQGGAKGIQYYVGIDYGPKRDRTALAVLHYDFPTQAVVVDRLDVWQGSPEAPIQIARVEEWLKDVDRLFSRPIVVIDPYQMEGTAQQWEADHEVDRFEAHGGKKTYEMCENLRSLIVNKRLIWYAGAGRVVTGGDQPDDLSFELRNLVLRMTPYGYRFDHEAQFHDDRAVAVGMAALRAVRDQTAPWVAPQKIQAPTPSPLTFSHQLRQRREDRSLFGMN